MDTPLAFDAIHDAPLVPILLAPPVPSATTPPLAPHAKPEISAKDKKQGGKKIGRPEKLSPTLAQWQKEVAHKKQRQDKGAKGKGKWGTPDQPKTHPSQFPRVEAVEESPEDRALPKRPLPGMICCPKKVHSHLAIMRCWEYQQVGCSCPAQAVRREVEILKFNMRFRDSPTRALVTAGYHDDPE